MWPNRQETADLAAFTEEILDEKLHFFVQCVFDKTFFVKTVNGFCPSSSFKDVRLGPEYVIGVKNYYSAWNAKTECQQVIFYGK